MNNKRTRNAILNFRVVLLKIYLYTLYLFNLGNFLFVNGDLFTSIRAYSKLKDIQPH